MFQISKQSVSAIGTTRNNHRRPREPYNISPYLKIISSKSAQQNRPANLVKIADGTWESYHQKHDQLFEEAVKALAEMGNCPSQRHLNQKQVDAIEAFISQDGGDRDMLCVDLWDAASPMIEYYWRDGTFNALEELRTGDPYNRKYGNGRSI